MAAHLVGYSAAITHADPAAGIGGSDADRAVRWERLRPDDPDRARLAARILGAGEHVETIVDIGTAPNGDLVVILPALPVRLADLLERPGWPTVGEAVTLLVPLVETLDRLHAAGVAHGGLRPGEVRFDERGTPVLCGFEQAVLRRTGAAAFDAAVLTDRAAMATVARGVLRHAEDDVDAILERIGRGATAEAVDSLFRFATPAPIRFEASPAGPVALAVALEPVPGRIGAPEARQAPTGPTPDRSTGARSSVVGAAARLRAALATVRPRVWVAAGASMALLVAAFVALPGSGADAGTAPPVVRAAGPSPTAVRTAAVTAPVTVAPRDWPPTRAAAALLSARADCLSRSSLQCLDGVDAAGSPLATADRAAISAGTDASPVSGAGARLLSFRADVAVLDAHGATVLAMRQPGGWLLRDIIGKPRA